VIGHQALELLGCVLAALVGVMQEAVELASAPDGRHQFAELDAHNREVDCTPANGQEQGGVLNWWPFVLC